MRDEAVTALCKATSALTANGQKVVWVGLSLPTSDDPGLHDLDYVVLLDEENPEELFEPLQDFLRVLHSTPVGAGLFVYPTFRMQQLRQFFRPDSFPVHLSVYSSLEGMVVHEGPLLTKAVARTFESLSGEAPRESIVDGIRDVDPLRTELLKLRQLWIETLVVTFGGSFPSEFRESEALHKFRYIERIASQLVGSAASPRLRSTSMASVGNAALKAAAELNQAISSTKQVSS